MTTPEARLARIEERSTEQAAEIFRNRDRIHSLETDRIGIALLAEKIGQLTEQTRRMGEQMHDIASAAAQKAVTLALEARDLEHLGRRGMRQQNVVAASGLIALAVSVVFHYA